LARLADDSIGIVSCKVDDAKFVLDCITVEGGRLGSKPEVAQEQSSRDAEAPGVSVCHALKAGGKAGVGTQVVGGLDS
jgi:hypothetical protein